MDGFGLNFAPTDQAGSGPNKPPAEPLQQAIQMLSLRLPHVVGAQGIAPGPLLNSPGGSPILELLARLFGQGRPGMGQPGMAPPMPGGAPMPSVHPGVGGPGGPQGPITPAPQSGQGGTAYDRGTGASVYPKGPWSDFPMPAAPLGPAPSAPAPMAQPTPSPQRDWLGSFGKNY